MEQALQSLQRVSIHAPREGCDLSLPAEGSQTPEVSIHAPREGCDLQLLFHLIYRTGFNSRTPGGVRRQMTHKPYYSHQGFNSRTPGGVRQYLSETTSHQGRFQFTHPGRGATGQCFPFRQIGRSFNSRTPGGVRPRHDANDGRTVRFQFTHPGRGATRSDLTKSVEDYIVSIHAPREGCDQQKGGDIPAFRGFQFTHPGRGATINEMLEGLGKVGFQFTHPGRGATIPSSGQNSRIASFNSRTPGGVRHEHSDDNLHH